MKITRRYRQCLLFLAVSISLALSSNASAIDRIITFGDSITSGVEQDAARTEIFCAANGVTTSPPYVCNGNGAKNVGGYQPYVQSQLLGQGIQVDQYNWGFAGKESDQLLGDISGVMAVQPSEYVFVMVGVNDVNEAGYSTATTVFNIERIIDRILEDGRIPVLGTVTPWISNSTFSARIQQINVGIKAYAAQPDIPVVVADHYAALIGNFPAYHSGDGLHLGSIGNSIVAGEWVTAFLASAPTAGSAFIPAVNFLLLGE